MLSEQEEMQVLRGVDEIIYNLKRISAEDVAYFLTKYEPELASDLATAIEFAIFDKELENAEQRY